MEERLRKFAQLTDAGSFTKAAVELHVSQPALSAAIAKLERELKTALFVRGARPLTLTTAGQVAYRAAKDLAVQTDNLKLRLAELAQEPVALRIGMIDSVADALFDTASGLVIFQTGKVSVVVNNSRYLVEAVERGDLDVAFIAERGKTLPALLESKSVGAEPLVVVSRSKKAGRSGNVLPNFISYDQQSHTFRLVQRALGEYGVVPDTLCYSTSPEVMLRLVLLQGGTAVLPYLLVRTYIHDGKLVCLGDAHPWLIRRNIVAIKRRDKALPLPLAKLSVQIGAVLAELMHDTAAINIDIL
jgi:DNA-binding transcriptional LysR family regulator